VNVEDRSAQSLPAGSSALPSAEPLVAVLLCTANGQAFLDQQLESIAGQSHRRLKLVISDDGSTDGTVSLIAQFAARHPQISVDIRKGPQQGFSANFMSIACDASIEADYFAFSDQDDIWLPQKIERALQWLNTVAPGVPSMYCGRTEAIDEQGQILGLSPLFAKQPSFKNAIVQSLAGGNTIVLNRAARDLVVSIGVLRVVAHDWWFYQLISGVNGLVLYDPEPCVQYRQHASNIIGSNSGWGARWRRIKGLFVGRFQSWNEINVQALEIISARLTPENRAVLARFSKVRDAGFAKRLAGLIGSGIYRQTFLGNLGLLAATVLKKI
jgi:glycosyltransferase involved in cell wall biosynthesis